MARLFAIHPDNPQSRLLRQAALCVAQDGLIVYPTDSGYALGCRLGSKAAVERIRRLRQLDNEHNMTLVCQDLSQLSTYAKVSTPVFRILKAFTPGAYTFILHATRAVPRLMLHPKKRTLGLRVPDHLVTRHLLEALEAPLMSTTLKLPGALDPLSEPEAIKDLLGNQIDVFVDAGKCDSNPTTVVDLTGDRPIILREGKGPVAPLRGY
jgi:tRNA threonylcarbamoyl adenosine modification protein (Sua5/YciO/YrdC/YwlC family)